MNDYHQLFQNAMILKGATDFRTIPYQASVDMPTTDRGRTLAGTVAGGRSIAIDASDNFERWEVGG